MAVAKKDKTESSAEIKALQAEVNALKAELEKTKKALTDALKQKETSKPAAQPKEKTIKDGHEYVDLGLPSGLKWAKYNVGADVPEAYGSYIAWGETDAKDDYSWATYKYYDSSFNTMTKYCSNERYGAVDGKEILEVKDDAANAKWGRTWRMPTAAEFEELYQVCTWEWTSINDVPGYKVTGPNGNYIFLPAAGYKNATNVLNKDGAGYYWSSTLLSKSNGRACYMIFDKESRKNDDYSRRYSGRSIRPVFE